LRAAPANWINPAFAADGRRLAVQIADGGNADVWVYDWARDGLSRLTTDAAPDTRPVWTPDDRRIVFSSLRNKNMPYNLYWQRADGTGEAERLTESQSVQYPGSWHPSGKLLAFTQVNPQTGRDVMILPMDGDETSGWKPGKPTVFLNDTFNEREPMFSPDGRWLAYVSLRTGRSEVYVRPFPGPGGERLVSTGGGANPTWSRTRSELFYEAPDDRIMVAPYTVQGDSFTADTRRRWSETPVMTRDDQRSFDLHPDGNRFAVAEAQAGVKRDTVVLIFNFFDELRRLAPPTP
jgi:serine/threonine-protein kinase